MWDVQDPTRPRRLGPSLAAHTGSVYTAAFAPDGHTLATAGEDKTVILWDVRDPGRPRPLGSALTGHADPVTSVVFAPDGATLATASDDVSVILWDVRDPDRPLQLGSPLTSSAGRVHVVVFAPDGQPMDEIEVRFDDFQLGSPLQLAWAPDEQLYVTAVPTSMT